jgi:hypothetical protein
MQPHRRLRTFQHKTNGWEHGGLESRCSFFIHRQPATGQSKTCVGACRRWTHVYHRRSIGAGSAACPVGELPSSLQRPQSRLHLHASPGQCCSDQNQGHCRPPGSDHREAGACGALQLASDRQRVGGRHPAHRPGGLGLATERADFARGQDKPPLVPSG